MAKKELFSLGCESLGFLSPKFRKKPPKDSDFPLLIRTMMNSRGGSGIIRIETQEDFSFNWENEFFWTPFIPTTMELRMHVFFRNTGEVIIPRIFKKVFDGNTPEEALPIRTQNNYHYSLRNKEKYPKAIEEATLFGQALYSKFNHGFFMSLDAGYSKEKKRYVFFEGNSASGLNNNTASVLAKFLYEEGVLE